MTLLIGTKRTLLGHPRIVYDGFSRANGPLGHSEAQDATGRPSFVRSWQSGGLTWAIVSNEAVNTPTEGAELVTNGDFSAWTGDDPDGWTVTDGGAYADVTEVATGEAHADAPTVGGGFCNIYRSGGGSVTDPSATQTGILTIGAWYSITLIVDTYTSGTLFLRNPGFSIAQYTSIGNKRTVYRALATSFQVATSADPSDITVDDISVKQLTLNTLFSSVETSTADVVCQVELDTVTAGTQAGLVLNLDDKDSPANFVIAYHDGTNAKLEKCVAGAYTSVISAAAAYAAGATAQVIKQGTSYTLIYNGVQIGATSTVNNVEIISNKLHGKFSTYSGNQLDNFRVEW